MSRADLEHAAELLDRLLPYATAAPWRDSTVDSNRYGALITTGPCVARRGYTCDEYAAAHPDIGHPHDGYGGCLVGESMTHGDRRVMAVMRNVVDLIPDLLRGCAHEDPVEVGTVARMLAAAVIDTHTPKDQQ